MYIKSYLKNSTTLLIEINRLLDCKGNRLSGGKGTKDYISNLGLTEDRCLELFGMGIQSLLSKSLTTKELDSKISIEVKIPKVDFKKISDMVFVGCPKEKIIPLNDEMLKFIL